MKAKWEASAYRIGTITRKQPKTALEWGLCKGTSGIAQPKTYSNGRFLLPENTAICIRTMYVPAKCGDHMYTSKYRYINICMHRANSYIYTYIIVETHATGIL